PDGPLGMLRAGRGQQLVGDDRPPAGAQRLARQDVPFADPRIGRVGRGPGRLPQVPAGPGMVTIAVTRQPQPLSGQPGPVGPQRVLEERRAGLWLANVQVDTRALDTGRPNVVAGGHPARVYRDLNLTSDPVCVNGQQHSPSGKDLAMLMARAVPAQADTPSRGRQNEGQPTAPRYGGAGNDY